MDIRSVSGGWARGLAVACLALLVGCGGGEARKARHIAQGDAFMAQRNYDKALLEYRNALQIDTKDAATRAKAGFAAEKSGRSEDAFKFYRVALAGDETLLLPRIRLARFYALAAMHDEAMEYLEPGVAQDPDNADLLAVRAIVKGNSGDEEGALRDAGAAVAKDPKNAEAATVLATALWQQGEREKALQGLSAAVTRIPDDASLRLTYAQMLFLADRKADTEQQLEEIVRLDPHEFMNRARLVEIYVLQRKFDEAVAAAHAAVKAHPDEIDAKLLVARLLASHESFEAAASAVGGYRKAEPRNLDLALAIGRFHEDFGRRAEAERIYEEVLDSKPTEAQQRKARTYLARTKMQSGHRDEARKLVERVLEESPGDADGLVTRAELALMAGDPGAAVIDLRKALGNEPDSVPLASALARAHLQAGEVELAEQTLRGVVQLNPSSIPARVALAQFLSEQGRPQHAKPVLEQVAVDHPGNVAAIAALARLQLGLRDYTGALKNAEMLQSLQPHSAVGFLIEGQAAEQQQRADQARQAYESAARLDPDSVDAVAGLVRLDVGAGRREQALALLGRRIESAASPAGYHVLRGQVLLLEKRPGDAITDFETAARLQPTFPPAHLSLAQAHSALGRDDQALDVLRKGMAAARGSRAVGIELATRLEAAGQVAEAARTYEDLLLRNAADDLAANNLAMLLATHKPDPGSLDRAYALARRFERSPVPAYLDTLGWVLYQRGQYPEAVAVLKQAVGRAADRAIYGHLGLAQLKAGMEQDARASLTAAVAPGPVYPGLEEAKKALRGL